MSKQDFNKMDLEQLTKELVDAKADLKQARLSKNSGELANPQQIPKLRKKIARIKTAISALMIKEREEE